MIKAVLAGLLLAGGAIGSYEVGRTDMAALGCLNAESFDAYCVTGKGPNGTTLFRCVTKDGVEHRFFDGGEA